jgi:hypothetical protein
MTHRFGSLDIGWTRPIDSSLTSTCMSIFWKTELIGRGRLDSFNLPNATWLGPNGPTVCRLRPLNRCLSPYQYQASLPNLLDFHLASSSVRSQPLSPPQPLANCLPLHRAPHQLLSLACSFAFLARPPSSIGKSAYYQPIRCCYPHAPSQTSCAAQGGLDPHPPLWI